MPAKALPDHSPLLAPNVICHQCGDTIMPEPQRNFRGEVEYILYKHTNQQKGCSYTAQSTAFLQAEMRVMRSDGTEVKL